MNVIILGDVVGDLGCRAVRAWLPQLKTKYQADLVVINAENSAQGNGTLPSSAHHLLDSGADVLTGGNHSFRRQEMHEVYDSELPILRPANFPPKAPGRGMLVVDKLRYQAAVLNLMGNVHMDQDLKSPFDAADELLASCSASLSILDFHAETTSEKRALGFYLDGRLSLMVGTHTHVQTADEQILPKGTGYITDLGMCGPVQSVLGVRPEAVIYRYRSCMPTRFDTAGGDCLINGIVAELDEKTGLCRKIERINRTVSV